MNHTVVHALEVAKSVYIFSNKFVDLSPQLRFQVAILKSKIVLGVKVFPRRSSTATRLAVDFGKMMCLC